MVSVMHFSSAIALLCFTSAAAADQPAKPRGWPFESLFFPTLSTSSGLNFSTSQSTSTSGIPTWPPPWTSESSSTSDSATTTLPPTTSDTTATSSGTVDTSTPTWLSITRPPTISVDWNTVSTSTTDSVTSPTHDSHGWPVLPVAHCWFCPPVGDGGDDFGIVIPGIKGPGIIPPPPPPVISSLGFSTGMPPITLDNEGDPEYPTAEPTTPTDPSTSTPSSSTSSCEETSTKYEPYVTCSTITGSTLLSSSRTCETSTSTVTGCDIVTTASTTTVPACPVSAAASISSAYESALSADGTVVNGTTYPLAFWGTDTEIPEGFSLSAFGVPSKSTSGPSSTLPPLTPTSWSFDPTFLSTALPSLTQTTFAPPPPVATWILYGADASCDDIDRDDYSWYRLSGDDKQSTHETCLNIKSDLPISSFLWESETCAWHPKGYGPDECSGVDIDQPQSFVIKNGFCTVFSGPDCTGESNGIDSGEYEGCTSIDDAFIDLGGWASVQCFAYT